MVRGVAADTFCLGAAAVVHFSNNMVNGVYENAMIPLNVFDDVVSPVSREVTFAAFVANILGVDGDFFDKPSYLDSPWI